ncbi:MAG: amino acid transporter substrate-binding protein [Verrucomicrobiaceae bacterium]|nr:amino acid transporter substrate-binding protein [Verrucomicrobiaceae bacterium]
MPPWIWPKPDILGTVSIAQMGNDHMPMRPHPTLLTRLLAFFALPLPLSMLRRQFWVLGLLILSACSPRQETGGAKPLVIGTDATYPPFEFKDAGGELSGVSIEMGRALAQHLGRPVEFRNIAFDGLITALQTGSIDIIISSMTANDERRKSLDFSDPYVTTGICLLLPKNSTLKSADELKEGQHTVVVKIATTGEQWARANLLKARIVALDSDPACVMEVGKGSADAWVYDQISVMNYGLRNPDTTKALLAPIRTEQWAVGLRKNDDLRAPINAFIADYRAKGGFGRLADKYLAKERDFMNGQGLPFVFDALAPVSKP